MRQLRRAAQRRQLHELPRRPVAEAVSGRRLGEWRQRRTWRMHRRLSVRQLWRHHHRPLRAMRRFLRRVRGQRDLLHSLRAARTDGAAASHAERRKRERYPAVADAGVSAVTPLAIESFGRFVVLCSATLAHSCVIWHPTTQTGSGNGSKLTQNCIPGRF